MSSHSMIYVGIYALIYLHTILGEGMDSRDGLPRGALPSGILKMEKYCPGHKVRSPFLTNAKLTAYLPRTVLPIPTVETWILVIVMAIQIRTKCVVKASNAKIGPIATE